MKIAILSREDNYSTRRLREAGEEAGHEMLILDTMRLSMSVERGVPELFHKGRSIIDLDAVVPRIGASITFYGAAVVRHLEQMGVFTLVSSKALATSRDKLRALQTLAQHVPMPPTAFVPVRRDVIPSIERLGGVPVIIKVLEGTQGTGVILAESLQVAEAIVETLQAVQRPVLIQKFVAESRGRDVRAFVVGGQVVAAVRRVAQKTDEYRSNVHRGARPEPIEITPAFEKMALKAARVLGLHVAGVDMLESNEGPLLMEVNSSPGIEGIERATGIDVAGAVLKHVEDQVLFPEVDVHQRLTFEHGHGVAEIPLGSKSPLVGKAIADIGFEEEGTRILLIRRRGTALPNPRAATVLETGDVLLCYGRLTTMRPHVARKRSLNDDG